MFYEFKPSKRRENSLARPKHTLQRARSLSAKLMGNIRTLIANYPGVASLILVLALAFIGAIIAGTLFFQGLFPGKPTVFKFDLENTLLGDRIAIPEGVTKQRALDNYLDSLDQAITADSIKNLMAPKIHDHADAPLH